jgi:hypothetical protein
MIDASVPPSTTEDEQAVWAMKKRVGAWRELLIKVGKQHRKQSQEQKESHGRQ